MIPNNSIRRFKSMRGKSRLAIKNELTEALLDFPKISFLESQLHETDFGRWEEYYALFSFKKIEDPKYLSYLLYQFNQIFKILKKFEIKDSGIQEIECDSYSYNLLIYIINNGEERESSNKWSEFEELFEECID